MATVNNPWVNYVTRSYQQIKQSLLTQLAVNNPEITDYSESNILIVIISMFSGIAEMLGYYIDNMAREAFIATARRFPSMVKLVKLLDYRIKAAYPSTADVLFTFDSVTTAISAIPLGTKLQTANNLNFITTTALQLPIGSINGSIGVKQVVPVIAQSLGNTDGSENQALAIGTNYVDNSSVLTVGTLIWNLVDTLGLASPTDQVYIIEIDTDGIAYVVFGDGVNGSIPTPGLAVSIDYDSTNGASGNVDVATINTIISTLSIPGVTTITVTNPLASSGGSDYEDIESIRKRAPLSIRTLQRAVTKQDYVDITLLYAGVGKAAIDFSCGKSLDIYIVPVGGGIAQSPLLTGAQTWIDTYKMVTTFPNILPAGETPLSMTIIATLKYRANTVQSQIDIQNALVAYGSYINQNINKQIHLSDINALIDNLPSVDFLKLTALGTQPYARPIGSQQELFWTRVTNSACLTKSLWQLEFNGTSFNVIKNNLFIGSASINIPFIDTDLTFTILPSSYVLSESWTFTTYPFNQDIALDDFTIPKVNLGDLNLTVIPQLVPPVQ